MILAAGTIHSPKLLMLSGVGKAKALRSLGIDLVENLPGVGQNLQDHVLLSGVVFKYKGKMPDRPADSNAVRAGEQWAPTPKRSFGWSVSGPMPNWMRCASMWSAWSSNEPASTLAS